MDEDPYLWLEDVHGTKPLAWVAEQDQRTRAVLKADPRYQADHDAVLKVLDAADRIPYGGFDHDYVFNYWQDAAHPKGIWRRTSAADYAKASPTWEILLDLDKLAADEHENWVWMGADCAPSLKRCLLSLSRGGGDAVVVREFDLRSKTFASPGFTLPEAKSTATYFDDDRVLFATDFGKGTLTDSGYPRIVKEWYRGMGFEESRQLFEGAATDVATQPVVFRGAHGPTALIVRAVDFFHTEYHYINQSGEVIKLPLPSGADVKGALGRNLILTLREDWRIEDTGYAKGSLISYTLEPGTDRAAPAEAVVIASPDQRSTIDEVSVGADAIYASVYDDVIGSIHVYRFNPNEPGYKAWSDRKLDLPAAGSTHIVSTNDWGPQAFFRFENFTTPTTLYADAGDGKPVPVKSLPARILATTNAPPCDSHSMPKLAE